MGSINAWRAYFTRLCSTYYHIDLQEIFGLPCTTTASKEKNKMTFFGGFSSQVLDTSSELYDDCLVIEASDEARVRRYIVVARKCAFY